MVNLTLKHGQMRRHAIVQQAAGRQAFMHEQLRAGSHIDHYYFRLTQENLLKLHINPNQTELMGQYIEFN